MSGVDSKACAAESLKELPLEGYYGGKPTRFVIDYDDMSSRHIGNAEGSVDNIVANLKSRTPQPSAVDEKELRVKISEAIRAPNFGKYSSGEPRQINCIIKAISPYLRQPPKATSAEVEILQLYWEADAAFQRGDDVTSMLKFGNATDRNRAYFAALPMGDAQSAEQPNFNCTVMEDNGGDLICATHGGVMNRNNLTSPCDKALATKDKVMGMIMCELTIRANFLSKSEPGSIEEAGYEFANALTEEYRKLCWDKLLSHVTISYPGMVAPHIIMETSECSHSEWPPKETQNAGKAHWDAIERMRAVFKSRWKTMRVSEGMLHELARAARQGIDKC